MNAKNNWKMNRAGLVNFWLYDEEEFWFKDGKLLLRGSNGSGKSVTMQSFIPLLLDGNKSPERLDPFQSRARRLENYLLGDEDSGRDDSTAYLYLEFIKPETENTLTIGMGFHAVRGKPLQSWGFSITDGRRIGKDFFLYKDVGEKIPLTRRELENRIQGGGQVHENQGDYMQMVNRLLFGFEDIDDYDELIKLLVQLRTPKLSKDFKPTVVYEIMENSLQPLSEDDLRPMSEAIENMDTIKSRLDLLKESKKACDRIRVVFDRYNAYVLHQKAKSLIFHHDELERVIAERNTLEKRQQENKAALEEARTRLAQLESEKRITEEKKRSLDQHDSLRLKEELREKESLLKEQESVLREKENQYGQKKDTRNQIRHRIKALEGRMETALLNMDRLLSEMDALSEDFFFDEQAFLKDELSKRKLEPYSFEFVRNRHARQEKALESLLDELKNEKLKVEAHDKAFKSLEHARNELEGAHSKAEQAHMLLLETREEIIERIHLWKKQNVELVMPEETLVFIQRLIGNFTQGSSFDEITQQVRTAYNRCESQLNQKMAEYAAERKQLEAKIRKLKDERLEWLGKKDPEPDRPEKVIRNRERLAKAGIPYIPFYKAVDFRNELTEGQRGRIEEALLEMGVLDALVVPDAYREAVFQMDPDMADRYLFSEPNYFSHNLSQFLKPEKCEVEGFSEENIDHVIQSILIDEGHTLFINEEGYYGIGPVKGRSSMIYEAGFIGVQARKRKREEIIRVLERQIDELNGQILSIDGQIQLLNGRIEALKQEYKSFPEGKDLLAAVDKVRSAMFEEERAKNEVNRCEIEEQRVYHELKAVRQRLHELMSSLNAKPDLNACREAVEAARSYRHKLYELETLHKDCLSQNSMLVEAGERLKDIMDDLDQLLFESAAAKRRIEELNARIQNAREQLLLSGYEQIRDEIDHCIKALEEIPKQMMAESTRIGQAQTKEEELAQALKEATVRLDAAKALSGLSAAIFDEELSLGYVKANDEAAPDRYKIARRLAKELSPYEKQTRKDLERLLYERFHEAVQSLREYVPKLDAIFQKQVEDDNPQVRELAEQSSRLDISVKARGKTVNFYALTDFISEGIEENENLLKESDRQLFEDILVKNISKKIRTKINHSRNWVDEMNRLMEQMDTSSGLSFSLKWSSKKAETESQLDTTDLVGLLLQEGMLLKPQDLNRLSEHFRSKIAEARRIQEDTGKNTTFHAIMREILDYRKWFEFKLFYVKTGQNKKELTNNAFFQFSGGEKAMAMYVPLFSAIYARYQSARKDCPRIISLDEAFAGVDEKNIRDMFRLLNELSLDFIINSQILWGDYDTVPALAISELIRPDNADFVTVIRYHWNGASMAMLEDSLPAFGDAASTQEGERL